MNQDEDIKDRAKTKLFVLMALWPFTIWMPFLWTDPKPKKKIKFGFRDFMLTTGCLFLVLFTFTACGLYFSR